MGGGYSAAGRCHTGAKDEGKRGMREETKDDSRDGYIEGMRERTLVPHTPTVAVMYKLR